MDSDFDDRAFAEEFGELLRRGLMEMAVAEEDALRFWPTAAGARWRVLTEATPDAAVVPVTELDPRD